MLLPILALALAPGDHAHLHPVDADLYFCVPEAQEAVTAMQTSSLWRLYKDPEITALLGDAPDLLSSIPFVPSYEEGEPALDSLESVVSYSLSIAGLDEIENIPANPFEDDLSEVLMGHEAMAVAEFETAEDAQAAMVLLAVLSTQAGLGEATETLHEVSGGTLKVKDYDVLGDSTRGLWVAKWGSYISIGFGEAGAPALVARIKGGESLASTEHWANGRAAMKEEGGTPYLTFHHNLIGDPWYAASVKESDVPMTDVLLSLAELLFSGTVPMGVSEKHGSCRIVDGVYVFETMDMGNTASNGSPPLSDDFLSLVNPEAVGVWATSMDSEETARTGHELLSTIIDIPAETIATELEYAVGTSLEELLAPLEKGVAFYMLPISGVTIPRFHAVVELEDSASYEAAWTKLAEFLKNQGGEFVEVTDRPYRKTPVFSLKQVTEDATPTDPNSPFAAMSSMGVMTPAFTVAILPDRAVFGISSSYVKREVRRLLKDDATTVTHPLAENGAPCPAGVNYFGHFDWPEVIGGVYDTVSAFLPLIADAGTMPFDVDALPETETITQYFSSTNVWSRAGESGTYTLKRSPIGFETGTGLAALVAGGVYGIQRGGFGSTAGFDVEIGQSPKEAFESPPLEVSEEIEEENPVAREETRRRLLEVKLGLVIYKSEKKGFPTALTELLAPTQSYPKGFLNSDALPDDGWGNPLQYVTQTEGAGYRLWSSGPDGVNNGGDGDDVPSP